MAADGSVTIEVDLSTDDAEKELTRIKRKILSLETELSVQGTKRARITDQIRRSEEELARLKSKVYKAPTEEYFADIERVKELNAGLEVSYADLKALQKSAEATELTLSGLEERYVDLAEGIRAERMETVAAQKAADAATAADKNRANATQATTSATSQLTSVQAQTNQVLSSLSAIAQRAAQSVLQTAQAINAVNLSNISGKTIAYSFLNSINAAVYGVIRAFRNLRAMAGSAIIGLINAIRTAGTGIVAGVQVIIGAIIRLPITISHALQTAGSAIMRFGKTAIEIIAKTLVFSVQSAGNAFRQLQAAIAGAVTSIGSKIQSMQAFIVNFARSVPSMLASLPSAIATAGKNFGSALLRTFVTGIVTAKQAILSGIRSIGSALSQLPGMALQGLKTAGSAFVNFGKTALNSMGKIAVTGIKKASSSLADLGSSALKSIPAAISKLNVFNRAGQQTGYTFRRVRELVASAFIFNILSSGLSSFVKKLGETTAANQAFSSALAGLKASLLSAFQPIYAAVLPAITSLMNALSGAISVIANFIAALFGKTIKMSTAKVATGNAKALGSQAKATKKAGKEAKQAEKSLASFDEINQLTFGKDDTNSGAGSGGGGGGGGGGTAIEPLFSSELLDTTPFETWGQAFDNFLDHIINEGLPAFSSAMDSFSKNVNTFSDNLLEMFTFPGVKDKVEKISSEIANILNDTVEKIDSNKLGSGIGAGFDLAVTFASTFIDKMSWENLGNSIANFINGAAGKIEWEKVGSLMFAGFEIGIETLSGFIVGADMSELAKAASDIATGFFDKIKETFDGLEWDEIGTQVSELVNDIKLDEVLTSAVTATTTVVNGITDFFSSFFSKTDWPKIFNDLYNAAKQAAEGIEWIEVFGNILTALGVVGGTILSVITGAIDGVGAYIVKQDWSDVADKAFTKLGEAFGTAVKILAGLGQDIIDFLKDEWKKVVDWWYDVAYEDGKFTIGGLLKGILDKLIGIGTWIKEHIFTPFINGVKKSFGIASPSKEMAIQGGYIIDGLLKGIVDALLNIGTWIVINVFDPVINAIKSAFGIGGEGSSASQLVGKGKSIISGFFDGIVDALVGVKNWVTTNIFNPVVTAVKKAFGITGEGGAASKLVSKGKSIISGLLNGIIDSLIGIKDWIVTNVFNPVINAVKTAFGITGDGSAASKLLDSGKSIIGGMLDGIKNALLNIGTWVNDNILDKIMEALKNAFSISNGVAGTLKEIGEAIVEGILSGLTEAWKNIKTWATNAVNNLKTLFGGAKAAANDIKTADVTPRMRSFEMQMNALESVNLPEPPALARGAVIPPNREFLAVLGDQRHGTNIEAPVSEIEGAVQRAMSTVGNLPSKNQDITLHIATESGFARYLKIELDKEDKRKGVKLVKGGS